MEMLSRRANLNLYDLADSVLVGVSRQVSNGHILPIEPNAWYVGAFRPEVPVAKLVLEVRMLVKHHQRAFAFEVPHIARYG